MSEYREHGGAWRSLQQLNLARCTKDEILAYFENGWNIYERLMGSLSSDRAYYLFPNTLRRPLIFYLGHTASLYINKFVAAGILKEEERVNPKLEDLFAVGVDEMSWDDMADEHFVWPPVEEVWEFRRQVKKVVLQAINETNFTLPITWNNRREWAIVMGFEHERIHLETSSVLIRELPIEYVQRPSDWLIAPSHGRAPPNTMLRVGGGTVTLGKPRDYPSYGWDNEYGALQVAVGAFEASRFKVTNGEWLHFINAKGYETRDYWCDEGWRWRQWRQARYPHFWVPIDASKYRFRTMYEVVDMPWDWPVEVNYLEAMAYCRWKGAGYRVISEPEWRLLTGVVERPPSVAETANSAETTAAAAAAATLERALQDDPAFYDGRYAANFDLRIGSSTPVNAYKPNALGFYDVFGNVWEWATTNFDGLPGFKVHNLYLDFSTPCFDGKHNMILGGSWTSTGNETSLYARYAFRRHFFQHAGFRLVREATDVMSYESTKLKNEYIHFHYGQAEELLPYPFGPITALEFPRRCAHECIEYSKKLLAQKRISAPLRALDLGCAVGRSTFELARLCQSVIGIDYSASFVQVACEIQQNGQIEYEIPTEGQLTKTLSAQVDADIDRTRAEFMRGDAHKLPKTLGDFHIVLAANLIDRLHTPMEFLERLPTLVKPNGVLMLTSPYTWLEQYTPRANWLGGFVDADGKEVTTFERLKRVLGVHFDLIDDKNMPFFIYEHQRKMQWSVAHATIWRRKNN